MKNISFVLLVSLIAGCSSWFINEHTSQISAIDNTCLDNEVWSVLNTKYKLDSAARVEFKNGLALIRMQPFPTEVYLFPGKPRELIAVSKDHYALRYVYNPEISEDVLDGFSEELNQKEKKRVVSRLYKELNKFQCLYGKIKSEELIDSIE